MKNRIASTEHSLDEKLSRLKQTIAEMGSAVVALSGGVDSSLVAFVAQEMLGDRALAVTSGSTSLKRTDLVLAEDLAAEWGMRHLVIETREMNNPEYRANPVNRCYFCKTTLYGELAKIARTHDMAFIINGSNLDDEGDYRPGLEAMREHGVRAPLAECRFRKRDIRAAAKRLGVRTADKPQSACLSSRVPYGTAITPTILRQIEAAEAVLLRFGFSQFRVRHHDAVARLELPPEEFKRAIEVREELIAGIKSCGYAFVALDLGGFQSGSMNALIAGTGTVPGRQPA